MNDRDRLIRRLNDWGIAEAEPLADYILANGVILPPCKVGQTVYYILFGKVYKGKCHAITQHENRLQIHLYDCDFDNASIKAENVFLTKSQAEEALKEREG